VAVTGGKDVEETLKKDGWTDGWMHGWAVALCQPGSLSICNLASLFSSLLNQNNTFV